MEGSYGEKCNQGSGESRSEEAGSARESGCSGEEGGGQEAGCESSRCEARSQSRAGKSRGKEAGSQEEVAPGPRPMRAQPGDRHWTFRFTDGCVCFPRAL